MKIKCFNVWTAIHAESGDMVVAIQDDEQPTQIGEYWVANYRLPYYPLLFVKDTPQFQEWMLEGSMKKMLLTIGLEEVESDTTAIV